MKIDKTYQHRVPDTRTAVATSRLLKIHTNKGKTIAQTITDRTDYAKNPLKTQHGELVTGYQCDPRTVDTEFLMAKKEYFRITGRSQKNDVLAYHIRQSFKPGEIIPEEANRLGHELAIRFTKGRHAFIVATHIDKSHVHNHIIFNSTNLDCTHKFVDFWRSNKALHRLNDVVCLENGYSVIEDPKPPKGHYGTWLGGKKEPSSREILEQIIDKALTQNPATFEDFIRLLEAEKCEFKRSRRSVRLPGKKGFLRLKGLSDDYTEGAIKERIAGLRSAPKRKKVATDISASPQTSTLPSERKFSLLIDVQNSIKAQNSPGYERWSKVFNLKQAAKTLLFLQDNDLDDIEKLAEAAQKAKNDFNAIQTKIHATNSRLKDISLLQKHIGAYVKTKDTYAEYKRRKFSNKFYAENKKAINNCKASKAYFDEQNLAKLPTINSLKKEYATLVAEKKKLYASQSTARNFMQEILMAQQNVRMLLDYRDTEQGIANDRLGR
jgi:hypothetical protein